MSQQKNRFDAVKVSSACSSSWEAISGTSQKKFCSECNKHVYDFSELSRREADAILEASRGNLCARITRTAEGKILSKEPIHVLPVKIQSRRTSPAATLLMSAILGITPIVTVVPLAATITYSQSSSQQNPDKTGGVGSISGVVTDMTDAVLPGATISLFQNSTELQTVKSNDEGGFSFQNLKAGEYSLKGYSSGFKPLVITEIQIREGQSFTMNVKFEAAAQFALAGVVAMPTKTLRVRYLESPLIVDATVGKSTIVEIDKFSKLVKTELHINAFLKGFQATTKIDYFHHSSEGEEAEFKEHDVVLAFLESREKGQQGFQSSHYQKGLQVLTASEMQTYAARISELRDLTYQRKPTSKEISEWLVRCAEEPVTRWEGVQELDSGFRNLKYRLEEIEQCKKEGKPIPESSAKASPRISLDQFEKKPDAEPDPDGKFAEALTVTQKNQLGEILFLTRNFSHDELPLLRLVVNWHKERSIPFVIHQLKQKWSEEFDPTSNLIEILENYFEEDEDFDELISNYEDIEVFDSHDLTKDELSADEKVERQQANKLALAQQKTALQKIIDAAEMKLRNSTQ